MLAHIYFTESVTVAYTVDIPDGMTVDEVANRLNASIEFYNDRLRRDLDDADRCGDTDVDYDDWVDEVDFTKEQVLNWIGE